VWLLTRRFSRRAVQVECLIHSLGTDSVESLTEAVRGASVVYSMVTPDVQKAPAPAFELTNTHGVKNLIAACEAANVPRLVYVSSIATTNHFISSKNWDETHALPPLSTYRSPYDRSKRLGEETIIAANGPRLATCALRLGGLLASPRDFTLRAMLATPGKIMTVRSQPIDYIGAPYILHLTYYILHLTSHILHLTGAQPADRLHRRARLLPRAAARRRAPQATAGRRRWAGGGRGLLRVTRQEGRDEQRQPRRV